MIQETATSIMSVGKPMEVAQKKKLFWLMRKNALEIPMDPTASDESSSSSSSTHRHHQKHESDHCASCKKSLTRIFSTAGSFCQICQKRVCSKCSVTKKLVIDATEKAVIIRPFNFCIGCILTARSYSSLEIHAEELTQRTHR
ncbi:Hypothetical protein PHPALM_16472 [Phytophthora palmivora]|uniref:FYVE-type domain-containing protein n=1 Tax=Phytophthora palmivora TaxID=4796 RepID=A0A2P4XPQ0_9STRA|nr:Hypothetical protein PHPALM_16472 [Phytophthora palmivora]